jgi:peptide/nickel transport system permease protein
MLSYVARRLVSSVIMLLGLVLGTFVLTHVIPANPASLAAGIRATPQQVAAVSRQLGLTKPLYIQLLDFCSQLLHGNLGTSFLTERPVTEDIALFFPATLELVIAAMILMVVIGVPIGVYLATGRYQAVKNALRVAMVSLMGFPAFLLALLLQIVFYGQLGWFPVGGRLGINQSPPPSMTHLYTVDSLLTGHFGLFGSAVWHLALPAASLALYRAGMVARFVESQTEQVLGSDYIRTARAAGLTQRRLVVRHLFRNAGAPVLTMVGLEFGWLLGGSVLVESIYSWPGMGNYILQSVGALDFYPVIAAALVLGAAFVVINFIVDVLHKAMDPRVSLI